MVMPNEEGRWEYLGVIGHGYGGPGHRLEVSYRTVPNHQKIEFRASYRNLVKSLRRLKVRYWVRMISLYVGATPGYFIPSYIASAGFDLWWQYVAVYVPCMLLWVQFVVALQNDLWHERNVAELELGKGFFTQWAEHVIAKEVD